MNKRCNGFTLVEILVVLGIIALLAALLFPAFNGARENARQRTCQSNLQQIGLAVQQYRKDEGRYPDSLLDLLGEGAKYAQPSPAPTYVPGELGRNAPGYLKAGQDSLTCLSDDSDSEIPRSSYGFLSKGAPSTLPNTLTGFTEDLGRYVWNYYGYREDGFAFSKPSEVAAALGTPAVSPTKLMPIDLLNTDTSVAYNEITNPVRFSLANRFAPISTIVTHCIYHRLPTANNLSSPGELYVVPADSANAKDAVLLIDGSARVIDVSQWKNLRKWQKQTP